MKRFLLVLCALLCFGMRVWGAEQPLTLEEAKTMALTDHPRLLVCDQGILNAQASYRAARDTRRENKDVQIIVPTTLSLAYVKEGYTMEAAESAIRLAEKEKKQVESQIAYEVTEQYVQCQSMEQLLEIAERGCVLAAETRQAVEQQFVLGMVTQLDVQSAQLAEKQAILQRETCKRNASLAAECFAIALHQPGVPSYELTDAMVVSSFVTDVEADLEQAKGNRYDIAALEEGERLATRYFEITKNYATGQAAVTYAAQSDAIKASYQCSYNSRLILLGVRGSYYEILNAQESMEIAQVKRDMQATQYEAAKLKFQMGMMTATQLTAALNELSQAEMELENAKCTYRLAVERYQYEVSIGL